MDISAFITMIFLTTFLYFGTSAHWFDIVVLGHRDNLIDVPAEIRACVSLAGLLGWSLRNDVAALWHSAGKKE
jgi:hypothetical protein